MKGNVTGPSEIGLHGQASYSGGVVRPQTNYYTPQATQAEPYTNTTLFSRVMLVL